MRPDTQNTLLLAAMRQAWITPADAYRIAGTLRFSGRVLDIKRMGYALAEKWIETQEGKRVKAFRVAP